MEGPATEILVALKDATMIWFARLFPYAVYLFFTLATIELTWTAIAGLLDGKPVEQLFAAVLRRVLHFGFLYLLLDRWLYFGPTIVGGFSRLGSVAGGTWDVSPDYFLQSAIWTVAKLNIAVVQTGLALAPPVAITAAIASVVAFASYLAMAVVVLLTLVETWFLLSGFFLFIAFGATRWTYALAEGYLAHLVRIGVRLFALYLLVGLIEPLTVRWANDLGTWEALTLVPLLRYAAGIFSLAALMVALPRFLSQLVPAHLHLGLNPAGRD